MPSQSEGAERPDSASPSTPSGKSPAFQVYPGDFLSDLKVALMTTEQIGAYWLLILHDWKENGLPLDLEDLAVLVKMDPAKFGAGWEKRISHCFVPHPVRAGHVTHPRLIKERASQEANRVKRQMAANTRWNVRAEQKQSAGDADAMHVHSTSTALGMQVHSGSIARADALQCSSASTSASTAEVQEHDAPTSDAVRVQEPATKRRAAAKANETPERALPWNRDASGLWEATRGVATKRICVRINQNMKPLVDAHGWATVRPVWEFFLEHEEERFISPERFVETYRVWERNVGAAAQAAEQARQATEAHRATILTVPATYRPNLEESANGF